MPKLLTVDCPTCGTDFTLSAADVSEIPSVTCPICADDVPLDEDGEEDEEEDND